MASPLEKRTSMMFGMRKRSSTSSVGKSGSSTDLPKLASSPLAGSPLRDSAGSDADEATIVDYREAKKPVVELFGRMDGDKERTNVLREIYTSEVAYINGLTKLVLVVARPIKSLGLKSPFTDAEKQSLFANCAALRRFHLQFLARLDERFGEWTAGSAISDLFLDMTVAESDYIEYCKNHDAANSLYEQISSRPKVQSFAKKALPHCEGQTIPALLILPVQRLPRYELLLRDLIRRTPDEHPDYLGLVAAAERIKDVSGKINESIRAHQKDKAFTDVKSTVSGVEDLKNNQERFLFECSYTVVSVGTGYPPPDEATKKRLKEEYGTAARILLFNNILVYTKRDTNKKKKDKSSKEKIATTAQGVAGKRFFLHTLWIDEMEDDRQKFVLMAPELRIQLEAGSVFDKAQTIQHVNQAISTWCQARPNLVRTVDGVERRVFNHNFSDGRKYKGDWDRCLPYGQCRIQMPNRDVYEGHNDNLVLCGHGKMTFHNESSYEGEWKDGLPHGAGTLRLAQGAGFYTGAWAQGQPDGYGELALADSGDSYAGDWQRGRMHGVGLYYFADGSFYYGDWKDGLWDGKGLWRAVDGGAYEGELHLQQRHGQGKMTYSTGETYVGDWCNDLRAGSGRYTFAGGRGYYEGEWEDNFPKGWGRLELASGALYEGEWERGKRKGAGRQRFSDRSEYDGQWSDDKRIGDGTLTLPSGARYVGAWHNDVFFGEGQYTEADGSRYEGKWIRGHRHGAGAQTYANGDVYAGEWKNDRRMGKGAYTRKLPDGLTLRYEGSWDNDVVHGHGVLTAGSVQYDGEFAHLIQHGAGAETSHFLATVARGSWDNGFRHGVFAIQKDGQPAGTECWNRGRFVAVPDFGSSPAPDGKEAKTDAKASSSAAAEPSPDAMPIDALIAASKGSSTSGALPYLTFSPIIPFSIPICPHGADISLFALENN